MPVDAQMLCVLVLATMPLPCTYPPAHLLQCSLACPERLTGEWMP